jgi:hypothetical protein
MGKDISAAKDTQANMEELLEAMFPIQSVAKLCDTMG